MKQFLLPLLGLLLFSVGTHAQQFATVRGRLTRGPYAAAYVPVTVYNQSMSRSPAVVTGQDGMYNIPRVPFGNYYLEVWVQPGQPLVFQIQVASPVTDIPSIALPFQ
jgi:hypothetical protein